jgi:methylated-DNA-[protein]-cysteine S-methyltransferase
MVKTAKRSNTKALSFTDRVYAVVKTIPKGKTMTYAEVTRKAGSPRAFRAVGGALAKNPDPKHVPCHRVIRADGRVGGYFGDMRREGEKRRKLIKEKAI